ncbi:MAG: CoA transferase [Deltaproteobacteria bacterium]|nr:CoA transferase [Deltaproteobacteria bacterium]
MQPTHAPLSALRVLETATLLPGPWASRILAELGADVVKIEPPGGDPARHYPPHRGGVGHLHLLLNAGKKSVVLDLKLPADRDAFLGLVRGADVLIESWRPGVAERLGLDYPALSAVNPRLVACSITGWGHEGPRRLLPGHDVNYEAWAGHLALTGDPRTGPAIPSVQLADLAGGTFPAVIAILAALRERDVTGRGRRLDVSMAVGAVSLGVMSLGLVDAGIPSPGPGDGPLTGRFPNYRIYPTEDGRLAVGCLEPKFWAALCEALGLPDLAGDAFAMGERRDEVVLRVEAKFAEATAVEWEERLRGVETCVERIRTPEEVLADPWLRETGAVYEHADPEGAPMAHFRALPCWTGGAVLGPAPGLGEHGGEERGGGGER